VIHCTKLLIAVGLSTFENMSPASVRLRSARRTFISSAAAAVAVVVFAPSVFAGTDSIRFEFGANGTWTVPDRVTEIEVEVAGAGGGGRSANGGNGALVRAAIEVAGGMTFDVGVGGGGESTLARQSGGGGASIVESGDILIIAGGGGGATNWSNAFGGDAGHDPATGAGQKGGNAAGGGTPGTNGTGGVLSGGNAGQNYDPDNGLHGNGGQSGRSAVVGGAGGEASNDSLGGGGGAGFGGGSSGKLVPFVNHRGGGGGGGSIARGTGVNLVVGASTFYSSNGGAGGLNSTAGSHGWVLITWVIPAPLPDPNESAGDDSIPPQPVVLQLAMPTGLSCSPPQSDSSGLWVQLPAAAECSLENSARSSAVNDNPAELLGWATKPNFPVDIAQRQIDNGWGAYELFDAAGDMTAVFIPAGGWTQASSDTNLFPIWAE
jgi:hypothetical protein